MGNLIFCQIFSEVKERGVGNKNTPGGITDHEGRFDKSISPTNMNEIEKIIVGTRALDPPMLFHTPPSSRIHNFEQILHTEQECIPVGCIPPHIIVWGGSL